MVIIWLNQVIIVSMKGHKMNRQKTQSGNMHLIAIIILATTLISVLGFVFWQNFIQPKASSVQNNITTPKTDSTSSTTNNITATTLVSNFYSEYMSVVNDKSITDSNAVIAKKLAIVTKYGTSNLITKYNTNTGIDNAICLQQYSGNQIVTGYKDNGSSTLVTIQEDMSLYNNDGSTKAIRDPLNIPVNVIDQNGLKIDSITCPAL